MGENQRSAPTSGITLCKNEAHDAHLQADNLTNWSQDYAQISGGEFYGSITELPFDDLQVFRERTSQALQQRCVVWPDSVWLGIPLAAQEDCRINGLSVGGATIMSRPGDCEFGLTTPENFDLYGLVVKRGTLTEMAERQGVVLDWEEIGNHGRLHLSEELLGQARFVLGRLLDESADHIRANRLSRDLALTVAIELLQKNRPEPVRMPSYHQRKKVVDITCHYIRNHADQALTVADLCTVAHVSRRTLQYSFAEILNMSPVQYLRVTRLNGVHRALLARRADQGVGEIAARWGFWHLSQFARDYRELFGELPSETLEKAGRAKNDAVRV